MTRCLQFLLTLMLVVAMPGAATGGKGDAIIAYKLGLAARSQGDLDRAYGLFKSACMASAPVADACLAWADLAEKRDNPKDVKRALSSAVILAPEDIRGRALLAAHLIKKGDFDWAKEHLTQAIRHAENDQDRALLQYYLGYVLLRTGDHKAAQEQLFGACPGLPEGFAQRCDFFEALIAERLGDRENAVARLKVAEAGEDGKWSEAAADVFESWSAFPTARGFSGQVSASMGPNTHPSVAFIDTMEADVNPVLQSIFRGDLLYSGDMGSNDFQGALTVYREQNWTEFAEEESEENAADQGADDHTSLADEFSPQDFNTTVFLAQAAVAAARWGQALEHEVRLGIDGDLQFLDHPPVKNEAINAYEREDDLFGLTGWSLGAKLWWSFARSRDSVYSMRLKVEGRPNYIDRNRSSVRYRLRLNHTRYLADRAVQLKLLAGTRYDRTYRDPVVIKYDRLMPEAELSVRWYTPISRLSALLGGQLRYNWYMNSRQNQKNSFRPQYVKIDFGDDVDPGLQKLLNTYFEKEYYDLTRQDLEWELSAEIRLDLWRGAQMALVYTRHQRSSNIDDAPTGRYITSDMETGEATVATLPPPRYSYVRDMVFGELRQRF